MPIFIRGEDDETLAKLKDMGFDAQVVSDDPMADLIFYAARMNAKLDNLGQLRHLHKMMQSMVRSRTDAEAEYKYYARLNAEHQAKMIRLHTLYDNLKKLTDSPKNKQWRDQLPSFVQLAPQNERDVLRAFQCTMDDLYRIQALEENIVYYKDTTGGELALGTVGSTHYLRLL